MFIVRLTSPRFILAVCALLCGVVIGQSALTVTASELSELLEPIITQYEGDVVVAVEHLGRDEAFHFQADKPMPTASLIKLAILAEAYRQSDKGDIDLSAMIQLREQDQVPGSGVLTQHFSPGAKLSLRDCLRLMIALSDNTATNMVIDQIGLKSTTQFMESLDLPNTKLHSKVFQRSTSIAPERSRQFGLGSTTARETVWLLRRIHEGKLVNRQACDAMLEHLRACDDRTKIARLLPPGTKFAHKTGAISKARCDAGIIESANGPIAICVLTNENEDRSWQDDNAANQLLAELGKTVFDYFNPDPDSPKQVAELAIGAGGKLVEALQRTLNVRIEPSPDLGVDGDFGPITRAAVIRFQKQENLTATGVVNGETWKALGPLVEQDTPAAPPDVVNREVLTLAPADNFDGRPFVTCKAWLIGDMSSGEGLWSDNEAARLDPASTTKIMTAHLVLRYMANHADAANAEITFSSKADDTEGSATALRAGERLPLHELLYGLLLPSGNDAAVALAEHIGQSLPGDAGSAYDRFVDLMNDRAAELGMKETAYRNPHGLTELEHQTSARDLFKLSLAAMKDEQFRRVVSTRQRGVQVHGEGGYMRNVIWKNTNRLLGTEGYQGIKTGTTDAAGACLVSCGTIKDRELIIVVLGSASNDARYVDSKNLYQWAWRNLEESRSRR